MPHPEDSLSPVAVVTGSSSGIGRATAVAFAQAGYDVVLHARENLAGLQDVARELLATSALQTPATLGLIGDIACPQTCRDLVGAAFAWRGRVDVWVNNAGADVLTGGGRVRSFESRLKQLLDVDVQGTIRLSRLVAPRMYAQSSRSGLPTSLPSIINIGWDQALLGMEGDPGQLFATTKAAVAAFSTSFSLSYPGLRVNCVAPGWIQTGWGETAASDYWAKRAVDESVQQRWGTAEDVAQTITWLASDSSRFVNGQTISVNGGRRYYPT